ncbi:MAG: LysM peptidoglycan-binding domain-containing protein [Candidatus Omnitrophica bacterium]|nr:LysM peptidoglycan-binding domain-containing protein [Candidatus Omnitrophota bacterium]
MKRLSWLLLFAFISIQVLGCAGTTVRHSTSREPRVDQEIAGNRGFIYGHPSSPPKEPTFKDRKVYRVEIEVPELPWNVDKGEITVERQKTKKLSQAPQADEDIEDQAAWGNQGYLMGTPAQESEETEEYDIEQKEPARTSKVTMPVKSKVISEDTAKTTTYTVKKGDTLQKISQKFYGTTKKWNMLYQANKQVLENPDKVFPGQTLNIPELGK